MTTTLTWESWERLPSGHRIFRTNDPARIAIADNSGRTPEVTDDGTLWLDFERPIVVAGKAAFAPVRSEEREEGFVTPIDFATALWLSETYQWPIKQHDICYLARRA
jgi:hypothetical protein